MIAIDRFPERLQMAGAGNAEMINYEEVDDVIEVLKYLTGGRGPDACIDAVGMEAHGHGMFSVYDSAKLALRLSFDRPTALREAIQACRKGGVLSIPGVYGGWLDKVPFGAIFGKGLMVRTGQTHVHKYLKPLLERVQRREIDPSFVITHRVSLQDGPEAYDMFKKKQNQCVKVVLDPWKEARAA